MEKELLESIKGLDREERKRLFDEKKSELFDDALAAVNGAGGDTCKGEVENPNSEECPYKGNWISSDGYVCDGEVMC